MENKEIYLLFMGNAYFDENSLSLLAVCSSESQAIRLASIAAKSDGEPLTEEDCNALYNEYETYGRDINYRICSQYLDQL